MTDVDLDRAACGADQIFGPGHLVKELVPDVHHLRELERAHAEARVRRIEQHQFLHALRVQAREPLRPGGARVVRDDAHLVEVVEVQERLDILGVVRVRVAGLRRDVRLVGVGEAAHVRDEDIEVLSERADVEMPLIPKAGPAVDEHERLAGTLAHVVQLDAVHGDVVVADLVYGHARFL
jgi:hypothetical protein